ncbi:MAG TPA: hypothetical protein VKD04_07045 [Burkholderiales bacterium]|nr:hypothetical protein [Burkholderiales bacterium]
MLPSSIRVIVRDWLNANHIVLIGCERTALADLIVGDLERSGAVRRLDGFLTAA